MNVKRNKRLLLVGSLAILLNFSSCSKYEDGPMFSLKTKKSRLTGADWEVVRMGETYMESPNKIILDFDKDGDLKVTSTNSYYEYGDSYTDTYTSLGEWEWEDGKESIEITIEGYVTEWEILRLTSDELWFEDEDRNEWQCEAE